MANISKLLSILGLLLFLFACSDNYDKIEGDWRLTRIEVEHPFEKNQLWTDGLGDYEWYIHFEYLYFFSYKLPCYEVHKGHILFEHDTIQFQDLPWEMKMAYELFPDSLILRNKKASYIFTRNEFHHPNNPFKNNLSNPNLSSCICGHDWTLDKITNDQNEMIQKAQSGSFIDTLFLNKYSQLFELLDTNVFKFSVDTFVIQNYNEDYLVLKHFNHADTTGQSTKNQYHYVRTLN